MAVNDLSTRRACGFIPSPTGWRMAYVNLDDSSVSIDDFVGWLVMEELRDGNGRPVPHGERWKDFEIADHEHGVIVSAAASNNYGPFGPSMSDEDIRKAVDQIRLRQTSEGK